MSALKDKDRTFNYDVQLTNYDVQLTAKNLLQLVAKTKSCVWGDEDFEPLNMRGYFCSTLNFSGKWVEVGE